MIVTDWEFMLPAFRQASIHLEFHHCNTAKVTSLLTAHKIQARVLEKASGSLCSWPSQEISNSRWRVDRRPRFKSAQRYKQMENNVLCHSLALKTGWLDPNAMYRDGQVNSMLIHSGGWRMIVDTHRFDESGKCLPGEASGSQLTASEKAPSGLNTEFNL